MKFLSFLLPLMLVSCGFAQHGIRVYAPVKTIDQKTGAVSQHTALLAAIDADLPGLKSMKIGALKLDFEPSTAVAEIPHFDPKTGAFIATETKPITSGVFVSEVTRAQGEADKMRIDSGGSAATGAGLTFVAPNLVGKGIGAATSAAKP